MGLKVRVSINQYFLTGNDFLSGSVVKKHDYKSRKDEFKPQLVQKVKKKLNLLVIEYVTAGRGGDIK